MLQHPPNLLRGRIPTDTINTASNAFPLHLIVREPLLSVDSRPELYLEGACPIQRPSSGPGGHVLVGDGAGPARAGATLPGSLKPTPRDRGPGRAPEDSGCLGRRARSLRPGRAWRVDRGHGLHRRIESRSSFVRTPSELSRGTRHPNSSMSGRGVGTAYPEVTAWFRIL